MSGASVNRTALFPNGNEDAPKDLSLDALYIVMCSDYKVRNVRLNSMGCGDVLCVPLRSMYHRSGVDLVTIVPQPLNLMM